MVPPCTGEDKHLLPVWAKFVEKGEVPFVKILADGDDAEYQFRTDVKYTPLWKPAPYSHTRANNVCAVCVRPL